MLTFNKTGLNILNDFILHELIVCDEKDPLLKIRLLIHKKNETCKVLRKKQIEKLKLMQNTF